MDPEHCLSLVLYFKKTVRVLKPDTLAPSQISPSLFSSTTCLILEYGFGEVCLVRACDLRLPVATQPVGLQDGAELLPHLRLLRARLTNQNKRSAIQDFCCIRQIFAL